MKAELEKNVERTPILLIPEFFPNRIILSSWTDLHMASRMDSPIRSDRNAGIELSIFLKWLGPNFRLRNISTTKKQNKKVIQRKQQSDSLAIAKVHEEQQRLKTMKLENVQGEIQQKIC